MPCPSFCSWSHEESLSVCGFCRWSRVLQHWNLNGSLKTRSRSASAHTGPDTLVLSHSLLTPRECEGVHLILIAPHVIDVLQTRPQPGHECLANAEQNDNEQHHSRHTLSDVWQQRPCLASSAIAFETVSQAEYSYCCYGAQRSV